MISRGQTVTPAMPALDRARRKAYLRLLPLVFLCYVVAYVDRTNVALAKLTMQKDLAFSDAVFGLASGVFFIGYFLLEIPGSLIVERWSARKWISRIMVSWGIFAALTAWVQTANQFYVARFLLGLGEAGFFPGIIVYLGHWFPTRDRAKALAYFFIAAPVAQIVSPKLINVLLKIGTDETVGGVLVHHPEIWGLEGWQWVYIASGIPAVVLGLVVLVVMTDRPAEARWLTADEREALEAELRRDKEQHRAAGHMTLWQGLKNPKVLLLAAAYFFTVTGSYGVQFFLPSILKQWYALDLDQLTWLVVLPPVAALAAQTLVAASSDRTRERRWHAVLPILIAAAALALTPWSRGHLALTVTLFMIALAGLKGYLPAFWSLPGLFLTSSAAAGSIGFINSVGNLGGFLGPTVLGAVQDKTGSYVGGIYFLCASMAVTVVILLSLGIGRRTATAATAAPAAAATNGS